MEGKHGGKDAYGREKQLVMKVANEKETRISAVTKSSSELVLRFVSFVLTFAAAVILGVDKQTKMAAISLGPTLPTVNIPVTAKWFYLSAFVYFVVVNAIACAYAAISFILLMLLTNNKGTKKSLSLMIISMFDLVMVALLFSGGGAAIAIGFIGFKGNSHTQWRKVCDVFGRFCSEIAAALILSLLASALFFLMVLLTTFKLHNTKA